MIRKSKKKHKTHTHTQAHIGAYPMELNGFQNLILWFSYRTYVLRLMFENCRKGLINLFSHAFSVEIIQPDFQLIYDKAEQQSVRQEIESLVNGWS